MHPPHNVWTAFCAGHGQRLSPSDRTNDGVSDHAGDTRIEPQRERQGRSRHRLSVRKSARKAFSCYGNAVAWQ